MGRRHRSVAGRLKRHRFSTTFYAAVGGADPLAASRGAAFQHHPLAASRGAVFQHYETNDLYTETHSLDDCTQMEKLLSVLSRENGIMNFYESDEAPAKSIEAPVPHWEDNHVGYYQAIGEVEKMQVEIAQMKAFLKALEEDRRVDVLTAQVDRLTSVCSQLQIESIAPIPSMHAADADHDKHATHGQTNDNEHQPSYDKLAATQSKVATLIADVDEAAMQSKVATLIADVDDHTNPSRLQQVDSKIEALVTKAENLAALQAMSNCAEEWQEQEVEESLDIGSTYSSLSHIVDRIPCVDEIRDHMYDISLAPFGCRKGGAGCGIGAFFVAQIIIAADERACEGM